VGISRSIITEEVDKTTKTLRITGVQTELSNPKLPEYQPKALSNPKLPE
jgi:hypothetical protein